MNKFLLEKLQGIGLNAMRRLPDFVVGGKDDPYLERWYIPGDIGKGCGD